jgi:peptidoglycan hydrolase-like protein with peptidoglycan-binding domain
MQTKNLALYLKSRLPWVLVALAIGAFAPAAAASPAHQQGKAALGSWGTYHPKGWSAGSVTRGTGYWRPGASLRVREVQRRLNRLDYASGKVDGFFGPITDAAVRRYQLDRGLELDGIVGPQTLRDLRSRTRRVQGSADRKTSGNEPQASGSKGTPAGAPRQDAAAHRAPQQEAGRSTSTPTAADRDGLDGRPWTELVLLGAGFVALLLLAGVLVIHAARAARRAATLMRARVRSARGRGGDRLYGAAYVEGLSGDERIGAFRGFAYIIRPMTSGAEQGEETTSLLVYDPSKPEPLSARLSEVTAINGQPVRPAARRGIGTEPAREAVARSEHPAVEPDRLGQPAAEIGRTASVTPLRPRRRKSRAGLQIVRRIEAPAPGRTGRSAHSRSGNGHRERSRSGTSRMSDVQGGRFPNRFRWLGARVYLADAEGIDHALTLPVELELFAESESRRWETGPLEIDEPLRVSVDDFEASVRAAVVPEWLAELAAALAEGGVAIDTDELARLPFAVERSIEVERAIAGMEAVSKRAS